MCCGCVVDVLWMCCGSVVDVLWKCCGSLVEVSGRFEEVSRSAVEVSWMYCRSTGSVVEVSESVVEVSWKRHESVAKFLKVLRVGLWNFCRDLLIFTRKVVVTVAEIKVVIRTGCEV